MKTRYTQKQLKEAIAYWKNKLRTLNERRDEDEDTDDEGGEVDPSAITDIVGDPDEMAKKAKTTPIGKLNVAAKFHRLHRGSAKKVEEGINSLLNKYKIQADVVVENSRDPDDEGFNIEGDEPMLITITIPMDRAKVKGWRKFLAVVKEDEEIEQIDEASIWGALWDGAKTTGGKVKDAAVEKIKDANEQLKKNIGLKAIQEYVKNFAGTALAKKVKLDNIFIAGDQEKDSEYKIYAALDWEV